MEALKRVTTTTNDKRRPVFAVLYDPRLPALPSIVKKHWRTMVAGDHHLREAFPLPPSVAYKRPQNLKDKLIRSKIPETQKRVRRNLPGMSKCNNCSICPFVSEGKIVKSTATNHTVEINKQVNCQTKNILYCITCERCTVQYIGETERSLQDRFSEHKGYAINQKTNKTTGEHFSQKGHRVSDMKVTILEKIFSSDPAIRKERERYFIVKMNTKLKGLNKIT